MTMGGGDSLLLPMTASTSRIYCSSAVSKKQQGNRRRHPLSRTLPACCCRTVLGVFPSLESRDVLRNGSRKRVPAIQAAAESRSVDAPAESSASSSSKSNGSQAQSHLDLLQRMTENSTASQGKTIRDQLASQQGETEAPDLVVVSLANGEEEKPVPELTVSQRRNIRRQNYLNKVSERNDAPFFATVAAIILVPPIVILAVAVATGYVELFP